MQLMFRYSVAVFILLFTTGAYGQSRVTYAVTSLTPTHAGLLTALDL
jgi:hypothetical protein